jgi:hypothetical protein
VSSPNRKNRKQINLELPQKGRGALARLVRHTGFTKTRVVTESLLFVEKSGFFGDMVRREKGGAA